MSPYWNIIRIHNLVYLISSNALFWIVLLVASLLIWVNYNDMFKTMHAYQYYI